MRPVFAALKAYTAALAEGGIENPRLEAEAYLSFLMKIDRGRLLFILRDDYDETYDPAMLDFIEKRKQGIPFHYLTGVKEFMGLDFQVAPGVFIPRPETELLVEEILTRLPKGQKGLELCAGSGCIALSLAKLGAHTMTTVEKMPTAYDYVLKNRKNLGVEDRVTVLRGDLFQPVPQEIFDFVVSNPPYLTAGEMLEIDTEVDVQPHEALFGGADGLFFYREIARESLRFLKKGGLIAFEIGMSQGQAVAEILAEHYTNIEVKPDYAGLDRMVFAIRK